MNDERDAKTDNAKAKESEEAQPLSKALFCIGLARAVIVGVQ